MRLGPVLPPMRRGHRPQRGNALVLALLGLLISALGAVALVQNGRLQARREAGNGEATILDDLRNATNNAIFESMGQIQNGSEISKNGVTVAPVEVDGQLVWQPTIVQLVGMSYLPAGWTTTQSTLNGAPYTISFTRVPAGCVVAACDIEGHVVLEGPIRSGPEATDGAVIGPILARLGADSGVSLPMSPDRISGFGGTWTLVNPVAGAPAGVVAVRVGTASSAFGQFVRIGDHRDPNLAGNLTVAGNTLFGDGSTTSEFKSEVRVDGQSVQVRDASGSACVSIRPSGVLDIACDGVLDAGTGSFKDAAGHVSTIGPAGIVTPGSVSADDGLRTPGVVAFASGDPTALVVQAGDLLMKNAAGTALLRVGADGNVTSGKDLVAGGDIQARRLVLTATVAEGDACSGAQVAMMATGGLATCQGGQFQATARFSSLGNACAVPGQPATDPRTGDFLVCRAGFFASVTGFLSPRVYMAGYTVKHGDFIGVSAALPNGCPATASPTPPQATLYLLPQSDVETAGNPVLNRDAVWTGAGWTISLTDGNGAPTGSLALAEVFCLYP
jgi:hypothetical protein